MGKLVFLGGSCNPTTWRKDIAIPALERARVPYFNPQVDDWNEEIQKRENVAKKEASCLLFVIDGQTRAIASLVEVPELMFTSRNLVLVVLDIPDGLVIDGQRITGRELKDLNRGRSYVRDMVRRAPNTVFAGSVEEAADLAIRRA